MEKTDAQKLQEWIKTIPIGEYSNKIDEILYKCKVSKTTLRNWRYGNSRIYPLAKDKIEEIARKKIFQKIRPNDND
jgi:hypothetical protein